MTLAEFVRSSSSAKLAHAFRKLRGISDNVFLKCTKLQNLIICFSKIIGADNCRFIVSDVAVVIFQNIAIYQQRS